MHILAAIDTCALPSMTQFCDKDGYDIVPVRMVMFVDDPNFEQRKKAIPETLPLEVELESSKKEFTSYFEEEFLDESTQATKETQKNLRELQLHSLEWVSKTKRQTKE